MHRKGDERCRIKHQLALLCPNSFCIGVRGTWPLDTECATANLTRLLENWWKRYPRSNSMVCDRWIFGIGEDGRAALRAQVLDRSYVCVHVFSP